MDLVDIKIETLLSMLAIKDIRYFDSVVLRVYYYIITMTELELLL